jgi:hypothetical protein
MRIVVSHIETWHPITVTVTVTVTVTGYLF